MRDIQSLTGAICMRKCFNGFELSGKWAVYRQPSYFIVAGVVSGIVYLLFLYLGREFLRFNIGFAHSLGYGCSVVTHFILNHTFTFPQRDRIFSKTIIKYTCMLVIGYSLMLFIVFGITNVLKLPLLLASFIALIINAFSSYQLSKRWVF